jgi:hypothetical protein
MPDATAMVRAGAELTPETPPTIPEFAADLAMGRTTGRVILPVVKACGVVRNNCV